MAKDETKRLAPGLLNEDKDAFAALQKVAGYTPADPQYAVAIGTTREGDMQTAQDDEAQKIADLKTSRDIAAAAEWKFHNFMLGAKKQVAAQFGDNSNELQALGLKKKSEYKSPKRKPKTQ